ncbi:ECF-type sigma factor [Dokdonella sp.]|uniref:ECF-type sigma factor n=1 Tax=Dokdonella sp. TaxID=2291710 RepID=UPI0031C33F0C|nr:ECF-type sigma factor [Dokdonella sp.]
MDEDVTQMLTAWRAGDEEARDRLIGVLYPELRRLAGQLFSRERADHTLQPTALVNEAWLRLSGVSVGNSQDRHHLLALLARSMRQILIDHARARAAAKRDGGRRMDLDGLEIADDANAIDLIGLDAALERLERIDSLKARIVELRYFTGMSVEDTADALDLSPATVKRHWQAARLWLYAALEGGASPGA